MCVFPSNPPANNMMKHKYLKFIIELAPDLLTSKHGVTHWHYGITAI